MQVSISQDPLTVCNWVSILGTDIHAFIEMPDDINL